MAAGAVLSAGERRRALAGILSCIGVYGITIGMSLPLMSLILEERGYDRTVIGLNSATMAVALLAFSPLMPRIVRHFGFRKVIGLSLLLEGGSFLALGFTTNIFVWFAIRVVMGAASTGLFLAGETWINQISTETTRGRSMALYATVLAATFGAGPLLIAATGTAGIFPFAVGTAIVLIAGVPLIFTGDIRPFMAEKSSFNVFGFIRLAPSLCAAVFLYAFIEMATLPLLPVYALEFGLPAALAAATLTALAAGTICLQFPIGWLADKMDRFTLLIFCSAGALIGAAALPFVVTEPRFLWPSLFLWGGVFASIYTISLALIGERYKGAELVTANASFGVLWGVGSLTGPTMGGFAMDVMGPNGLPAVICAFSGGFLVLALVRQKRARSRRPNA